MFANNGLEPKVTIYSQMPRAVEFLHLVIIQPGMMSEPIKYQSGSAIRIGDWVSVGVNLSGEVVAFEDDSSWLGEPDDPIGIYVETKAAGLVRVSPSDEDLVLISRREDRTEASD